MTDTPHPDGCDTSGEHQEPAAWRIGDDGGYIYQTREEADRHIQGWHDLGMTCSEPQPLFAHPPSRAEVAAPVEPLVEQLLAPKRYSLGKDQHDDPVYREYPPTALDRKAASALSRIAGERDEALSDVTRGIEQEQHLMSRLGLETRAREKAEAERDGYQARVIPAETRVVELEHRVLELEARERQMREALQMARPYIINLIGFSMRRAPPALLRTKRLIDAALKEEERT